MATDWHEVGQDMLAAAARVFLRAWPAVASYAIAEVESFTADCRTIETLLATGAITPEDAADMIGVQRDSMQAVLLSVTGLNQLTIEQAVNAAVDVAVKSLEAAITI